MKYLRYHPILYLVSFIASSCSSNTECEKLFPRQDAIKDSINYSIFKIEVKQTTKGCLYKHEFKSWNGVVDNGEFKPLFTISGTITKKKNTLLLHPDGNDSLVTYFDFGMKENQVISVEFNFITKNFNGKQEKRSKKYKLVLEKKFFDRGYADTIYRFKFEGFSYKYPGDNLVFLIGKDVGLINIYASVIDNHEECIYTSIGNQIINSDNKIKMCGDIL